MSLARYAAAASLGVALSACSASALGPAAPSAAPASVSPRYAAGSVQVRFVEGAPALQTPVAGTPQALGATSFLTVNGQTVSQPGGGLGQGAFVYGWITPFLYVQKGVSSLTVYDSIGYSVGPLKTANMAAGGRYTVIIVGSYPHYRTLTIAEPTLKPGAFLSVYEASPSKQTIDFGTFSASKSCGSSASNYRRLGSAHFGKLTTVSLGRSRANLGGYVGTGKTPVTNGSVPLCVANPFDVKNELPFGNSYRLSLFFLDTAQGGPVFETLDQ